MSVNMTWKAKGDQWEKGRPRKGKGVDVEGNMLTVQYVCL